MNKLYNGRMTSEVKGKDRKFHPVKNARPGFLIRTKDNKFFIAPSIYRTDRKDDKILILEYEEKFGVRIPERNSACVKWDDLQKKKAGNPTTFKLPTSTTANESATTFRKIFSQKKLLTLQTSTAHPLMQPNPTSYI